ncbi:hypothetical protein CY34DRAFT_184957 [Suillus luteus UH-Slu-Lm8-n1]|uniref:Uncharacterized protein n=1 Tax=Suillus luteus UH-Slu-Lm8-n1 TaxID=930992 RepID=A0A0D0AIQ9_9AGAM|nr:hypothetical protein CY34DRAFT_184957 [Suillus luteus UH-Slu-Lm8-n1]
MHSHPSCHATHPSAHTTPLSQTTHFFNCTISLDNTSFNGLSFMGLGGFFTSASCMEPRFFSFGFFPSFAALIALREGKTRVIPDGTWPFCLVSLIDCDVEAPSSSSAKESKSSMLEKLVS